MPRFEVRYATIPLSGTLSEQIEVRGATSVALWMPVITGSQAFIQGAFDQTSTNFVRLTNTAGSGDYTLGVITGSRAFTLDAFVAFPYLRLETQTAQAAVRSLAIITRW